MVAALADHGNGLRMSKSGLFAECGLSSPASGGDGPVPPTSASWAGQRSAYVPQVTDRLIDLFEKAANPADPFELRDLYLGRVETETGGGDRSSPAAALWHAARRQRTVNPAEILASRALVRMTKELFNAFFRDDLYGTRRNDETIILSSGAVCEESFGLPDAAKQAVQFALDRDWYGYSDSRGRNSTREALAQLEAARVGAPYTEANIALVMGATFGINAIADFVLTGQSLTQPVLCAIPNYPPLVENIARRAAVQLVPLGSNEGQVDLEPLIASLTDQTPMVLLQTVNNPTGALVAEADLARLIELAAPTTMIVLDECHEFLGPSIKRSPARARANVIRVSSISKTWSAPGIKLGWIVADAAVIDSYYEFASTTYGGPPSLFYTLMETLARFERWLEAGLDAAGPAELAEFGNGYGLTLVNLDRAYRAYVVQRAVRERRLIDQRGALLSGFEERGFAVLKPHYSINAAVFLPGATDSYAAYREMMRGYNVSTYPGVLNFCFDEALMRVTSSRRWSELGQCLERLARPLTF